MNTPRSASDIIRGIIRGDIQPIGALCAFLFGFIFSAPIMLILGGHFVRGMQGSFLLTAAVAIVAATSPWWVDTIEEREIDRVLRERIDS